MLKVEASIWMEHMASVLVNGVEACPDSAEGEVNDSLDEYT